MELENMVPRLIEGQLIEHGHRLIYESKENEAQVVLPLKYKMILSHIDGKNNIQTIARKLFETENTFSFKDLFECLDSLASNKLVENIDNLNIRKTENKNVYEKKLPLISKPLYEKIVLKRIILNQSFPLIFVLMSAIIIFIGQKSFLEFNDLTYLNKFLKINDSYTTGLIFFLIANSLLITFKNVFKLVLLLLATGRVYNLKIKINVFSISFRVDDASIYTTKYKWHGVLYCLSCISSYYVLIYVASLFQNNLGFHKMMMDQLFVMATFLTIVDLDPFRKSDTSRLFNIFYEEENMGHLLPYLKKKALLAVSNKSSDWKKEILFVAYSTLALFWLFNAFGLSLNLLDQVFPNLASSIINGELSEKISSGIIALSLALLTLYFIGDLLKILSLNLLYPCRNILRRMFSQKRKNKSIDNLETLNSLKGVSLFQDLDEDYLKQMISHGHHYNFNDGYKIISQGESGDSVFILLKGCVDIIIHRDSGSEEHVAVLSENSVFGELALLNNDKRSADVISKGKTLVLEINRHDFEKLESFEGHEAIVKKIKLNQFISSSSLFDKLPNEAINIFTKSGEIKSFEGHSDIFKQGDPEDGFYLLYEGSVTVVIDNEDLAIIDQGGFFGEMALLRNDVRNATIRTNSVVNVLRISSEIFWQLLFQNINLAIFLETVAGLRLEEDQKRGGVVV